MTNPVSPRMLDVLRTLNRGGVNDKIHWLGGINACAYRSSDLKSFTTTVIALRDRGLVEIIFNSTHNGNGRVEITPNGIAHLESIK